MSNDEKKVETIEINTYDKTLQKTIYDKVNAGSLYGNNNEIERRNHVEVDVVDIRTGEKVDERKSNNLVLFRGRSWLLQRAINMNLGMNNWEGEPHGYPCGNAKNSYISWLGLGSGGHLEDNVLKPKAVRPTEYDLNIWAVHKEESTIPYADSVLNENILYYKTTSGDSIIWRQYHRISAIQILTDPAIDMGKYDEMDDNFPFNDYKVDSYLLALAITSIEDYEYIIPTGEYDGQVISEAGLFVSDEIDKVPSEPSVIFAKTNFSAINKDKWRKLIFRWYLYF